MTLQYIINKIKIYLPNRLYIYLVYDEVIIDVKYNIIGTTAINGFVCTFVSLSANPITLIK